MIYHLCPSHLTKVSWFCMSTGTDQTRKQRVQFYDWVIIRTKRSSGKISCMHFESQMYLLLYSCWLNMRYLLHSCNSFALDWDSCTHNARVSALTLLICILIEFCADSLVFEYFLSSSILISWAFSAESYRSFTRSVLHMAIMTVAMSDLRSKRHKSWVQWL